MRCVRYMKEVLEKGTNLDHACTYLSVGLKRGCCKDLEAHGTSIDRTVWTVSVEVERDRRIVIRLKRH